VTKWWLKIGAWLGGGFCGGGFSGGTRIGGGIRSTGIGAHSKGISKSGDDGGVCGGVGGLGIGTTEATGRPGWTSADVGSMIEQQECVSSSKHWIPGDGPGCTLAMGWPSPWSHGCGIRWAKNRKYRPLLIPGVGCHGSTLAIFFGVCCVVLSSSNLNRQVQRLSTRFSCSNRNRYARRRLLLRWRTLQPAREPRCFGGPPWGSASWSPECPAVRCVPPSLTPGPTGHSRLVHLLPWSLHTWWIGVHFVEHLPWCCRYADTMSSHQQCTNLHSATTKHRYQSNWIIHMYEY